MMDNELLLLKEKTNYIQQDVAEIKDDVASLTREVHEINTWVAVQKDKVQSKSSGEMTWTTRITLFVAVIMLIVEVAIFAGEYEIHNVDHPPERQVVKLST